MKTRNLACRLQHGFSLIEMMLVVAIMGVISAGILSQMNEAQQRGYSEQVKVDNFDEARDFVDQFFRDINQIGYPNGHMVNFLSPTLTTAQQDTRVAVGLVKIDGNAIWFEGDVGGTGVVQSVQYKVNGSGTCSVCLQRSSVPKVAGDPLTGQGTP